MPAVSGAQVPTAPATLHAMQVPVQLEAQHTPSAQKPEAQSAPRKHVPPSDFSATHAPKEQTRPALQSLSERHGAWHEDWPLHTPALHSEAGSVPSAYGVQPPTSPATLQASHVPLHAPLQHTPSTQKPEAQSAPWEQVRPLPFGPAQFPPAQLPLPLHSALEAQVASQVP